MIVIMQICQLISIQTLTILISWQFFHWSIVIEASPIVPILTALATSAAGLFSIQIDTLHIAKYLRDAAHHKRNRGAFVRDLLYTAFYRSGQAYNVIVFNLGEEHHQRLHGVIFYGSVAFADHTRFGVWVFEYGTFENQGARGWHNWGMIGSFKKNKDGNIIYFQRRHNPRPPPIDLAEQHDNSTQTIELKATQDSLQDMFDHHNKLNAMENVEIKHESRENEKPKKHKINVRIEDKRTKKKSKSLQDKMIGLDPQIG